MPKGASTAQVNLRKLLYTDSSLTVMSGAKIATYPFAQTSVTDRAHPRNRQYSYSFLPGPVVVEFVRGWGLARTSIFLQFFRSRSFTFHRGKVVAARKRTPADPCIVFSPIHNHCSIATFVLTYSHRLADKPHNTSYVVIGTVFLRFGWFGCVLSSYVSLLLSFLRGIVASHLFL
jgi:hypothetical protein